MNNKQREPFKEAKIPDWRIIERYNKILPILFLWCLEVK